MSSNPQIELFGNIVGLCVAALIAGWVRYDAKKRGMTGAAALGWSVGVFLMLILFLPAYLWLRRNDSPSPSVSQTPAAPIAGVPCPYCGYENAGKSDYCGKCGRQLRSSTEIHR